MGFGKLMTRSVEITQTDTTTGEVWTGFIDNGIAPDFASGYPYHGLHIPGAWRASIMIAELLGQIPWDAYREMADRPIEKLTPTPPLLDQPAPPMTRIETISSLALDYLWTGNCVAVVAARNALGWPTAYWPVPSTMVAVRRIFAQEYEGLPIGALEYNVGALTGLSSYDVLHVKSPALAPGGLRGMGVLETHFATIDTANKQQRQARSVASHGVPTGVLTTTNEDATPADMEKAKAKWMANQAAATVQALGPTTQFTPLSWNPEQMQMIAARQFTLTEWELIFGMPPGWLGGPTSSRTYTNQEQDNLNLIKFTLAGHLTRFEHALSLMFPRGTNVKANLDAFLRSDTMTRYQAHALGLEKGFLTLDEVREMENRPPLPPEPTPAAPDQQPAVEADDDTAGMTADELDDLNEIDPMEEVN